MKAKLIQDIEQLPASYLICLSPGIVTYYPGERKMLTDKVNRLSDAQIITWKYYISNRSETMYISM